MAAVPDEHALRSALDADGVLLPGALAAPAREACFTVFAQQKAARIDLDAWENHAARFFPTRLGLTADKRYEGASGPREDCARVVLFPAGGSPGRASLRKAADRPRPRRRRAGRSRRLRDGAARARDADTSGSWSAKARDPTALALRLAAIIASVVLGPILTPDGSAIFGVKTAKRAPRDCVSAHTRS